MSAPVRCRDELAGLARVAEMRSAEQLLAGRALCERRKTPCSFDMQRLWSGAAWRVHLEHAYAAGCSEFSLTVRVDAAPTEGLLYGEHVSATELAVFSAAKQLFHSPVSGPALFLTEYF